MYEIHLIPPAGDTLFTLHTNYLYNWQDSFNFVNYRVRIYHLFLAHSCLTGFFRSFALTGDGQITQSDAQTPNSGTAAPGTPGADIVRVRLPNKHKGEQFAYAELMLGSFHIRVRCSDGITRLGRIKGKMKRRSWIREGDVIIITPWSFQDEKCDISYRYTPPQRDWLRRNNYI